MVVVVVVVVVGVLSEINVTCDKFVERGAGLSQELEEARCSL